MNLFDFGDYKAYLTAYVKSLPKQGRGELGRIAQHLRINSTLVSQILRGPKDFTFEQAHELSQYLGHNNIEADYFLFMVQLSRAGTQKLKKYWQGKLMELKQESLSMAEVLPKDRNLTEEERLRFYSSWHYSAIHLYCGFGKGQSVDSIADYFHLERGRVVEILRFMVDCGLCNQDGGLYSVGAQRTHLEYGSPHLNRHHTNWRMQSLQRAEKLTEEELMFTAPLSLSKKDYMKVREQLAALIKDLYVMVKESPSEELACLNIDWFFVKDI